MIDAQQLQASLATSNSDIRKYWARCIVENRIPLESLMSLLHSDDKTTERFTWLIGDICELDPDMVACCMPLLFSLRNQMPFPGMQRSVAKWLWLTNVPEEIEPEAIKQLFHWLGDPASSIGSKSFAAKGLYQMVVQGRAPLKQFKKVLKSQIGGSNKAYSSRMEKLLTQVEAL